MKRWWLWLLLVGLVAFAGVFFVLMNLVTLQPPVVEANFFERRKARTYRETTSAPSIATQRKLEAGKGVLFATTTGAGRAIPSRTVLWLPDSGTGAWMFENLVARVPGQHYALSVRGQFGTPEQSNATLEDYVLDAKDAVRVALKDSGSKTLVLAASGLGSLLALRLAQEKPVWLAGLVLLAPYTPKERVGVQSWLAQHVGGWVYDGVFQSQESLRSFWEANFPNGFVQSGQAAKYYFAYAKNDLPFESKAVIKTAILGPLPWLAQAYQALDVPTLQLVARYDNLNPLTAQLVLRDLLAQHLDRRFAFALLNSGRYLGLDWKWKETASVLMDYLADFQLDTPVLETETPLDPALERDPALQEPQR